MAQWITVALPDTKDQIFLSLDRASFIGPSSRDDTWSALVFGDDAYIDVAEPFKELSARLRNMRNA